MTLLLALSQALALDCGSRDALTCAAVNALQPEVNALIGSNVIHDAAAGRLRPHSLYERLFAARQVAEAGGCTVDGTWIAGTYEPTSWQAVWSDAGTVRDGDGVLDTGLRRFHGELQTASEPERLGWEWSTYDPSGALVTHVDGGLAIGVWVRVQGSRGVHALMRASCTDDATARAAGDPWVTESVPSICVLDARWVDGDGDGSGTGSPTVACAATGLAEDGDDCDDTDATVFPGALERCDGQQNDCDDAGWTDDAGLATFLTSEGAASDETAVLGAGIDGDPATATYRDGTLSVCAGTWYVSLTLRGAITLTGVDGRHAVILDGGDDARVLRGTGSATELVVQDVTLRNGRSGATGGGLYASNTLAVLMERVDVLENQVTLVDVGGGLALVGVDAVALSDVIIQDHQAGGLYTSGCDIVDLTGVQLLGNASPSRAGGWVQEGAATVWSASGLTVTGNRAHGGQGGGLAVEGTGWIIGSSFVENDSFFSGGAIWVDGDLTVRDSQLIDNIADDGAGIRVDGGTTILENVDFAGNQLDDVRAGTSYTFGAATYATCTATDGCL